MHYLRLGASICCLIPQTHAQDIRIGHLHSQSVKICGATHDTFGPIEDVLVPLVPRALHFLQQRVCEGFDEAWSTNEGCDHRRQLTCGLPFPA